MELGRKRSHPVGTHVLGGDSEEKRDYMGRDPPQRMSGSRQMLAPSHPGILHREGEPPWLVGEPVGLTERLWKAWTPLFKNTCILACSWISEKKEDWKLHKWLASFPRLPPPSPGSCSRLSLGKTLALLASRCSCTFTFSTLSLFSFLDHYNVSASTLILPYRTFKLFSVLKI